MFEPTDARAYGDELRKAVFRAQTKGRHHAEARDDDTPHSAPRSLAAPKMGCCMCFIARLSLDDAPGPGRTATCPGRNSLPVLERCTAWRQPATAPGGESQQHR